MWSMVGWIFSVLALCAAAFLGFIAAVISPYFILPALSAVAFAVVTNPLTAKALGLSRSGWIVGGCIIATVTMGVAALAFAFVQYSQTQNEQATPARDAAPEATSTPEQLVAAFDRARTYDIAVAANCSLLSTIIQLGNAHNVTPPEQRTSFADSTFTALKFGDERFELPSDDAAQRMGRFWELVQRAQIEDRFPGEDYSSKAGELTLVARDRWSETQRGPRSEFTAGQPVVIDMLAEDRVCFSDPAIPLTPAS